MALKIKRDKNLDVGYVSFKKGKIVETVEIRPGVLLDLNRTGDILGIEVLSLKKIAPQLLTKKQSKQAA